MIKARIRCICEVISICFENERPISFLFMDFPFKINDSVSLRWDFWISPYIYLRCCRYIVVHEFLCRGAFCFFINKSVEPLTKSHLIWDQADKWIDLYEKFRFWTDASLSFLGAIVVIVQMKLICGNELNAAPLALSLSLFDQH